MIQRLIDSKKHITLCELYFFQGLDGRLSDELILNSKMINHIQILA